MRVLLASALVLPLTFAVACSDPTDNKPVAKVGATKTALEKTADSVAGAAKNIGSKSFAFSNDNGSKIGFVGSKVTGSHEGGFKKFTGTVSTKDGKVSAVKTDIDMSTTFSDAAKLTGHLLSPDFFDVSKFAKASFESTKITTEAGGKATVVGNLTLRGVTKEITFPAMLKVTADAVTVNAEFAVNRKDFNIVYPGKPDDLIRDKVLLKLNVTAKPKA